MEAATWIYLYVVIENLVAGLKALVVVGVVAFLFMSFATLITSFDKHVSDIAKRDYERCKRWLKSVCLWFCVTSILVVFFPDREDVALIFGGAALVSVAQTEEAQKLPENVLKAANKFLDEVEVEESPEGSPR